MRNIEKAIFTNMILIRSGSRVLVIERADEGWPGIAFPGGHVEDGEPFTASAIREAKEETGLEVRDLRLCGVKDWIREDGVRYVVFLYETDRFTGEVKSSEEGSVFWVEYDRLEELPLARSMDVTLRVYREAALSEHCMRREDGEWKGWLL